jgi:thymidylate kinase
MVATAMKSPLLISFSGVDGSGKTTQIKNLRSCLDTAGLQTRVLTFWDNAVVAVKYRESFVHRLYKSEHGVGAPGKPVNRRDKNMRGWHLTLVRHVLYLLDAVNLCRVVARERTAKGRESGPPDIIIFDRYIYDELANLNLDSRFSRAFIRLIHAMAPRPDVAYLLDADPAEAYARKPEYPLDFMTRCRRAYFDLAALLGSMTIVPAVGLGEARRAVIDAAQQRLAATRVSDNSQRHKSAPTSLAH